MNDWHKNFGPIKTRSDLACTNQVFKTQPRRMSTRSGTRSWESCIRCAWKICQVEEMWKVLTTSPTSSTRPIRLLLQSELQEMGMLSFPQFVRNLQSSIPILPCLTFGL